MTTNDDIRQRVLAQIREDDALALFQRAIQTPSITGNEYEYVQLLADELRAIGLHQVELVHFQPGRPNVWGVLRGVGSERRLLLAGHTDTVGVAGWEERWQGTSRVSPFAGALEDGAIWGRGAGDMKAGVIACVYALRAIQDAGVRLQGDVVAAFVGDEESGIPGLGRSEGMKAIVSGIQTGAIPRADFAIYTEPTALAIYTAQMGFIIADISVTGRSAYFGVPWHGVDALKGMHKLLARLFDQSDRIWGREEHSLLGRAFTLVTAIHGGGYIAVPELCTISLIRKILPSETVEHAASDLESLVRLVAMNEGLQVEISYTAGRDSAYGGRAAEVSPDLPGVTSLERAIANVTGAQDVLGGAPYWSEMSLLVSQGIPTVYFGAGNIMNCHTLEERVDLRQFIDSIGVLALAIVDYCGVASS